MLDEFKDLLRTFDQVSFRVMAGGSAAPTEARMEGFESALGCRLPEEFREFTLSPLGGFYLEAREDVWPRPKPNAKASWRDQFGLKVFGLAAPIPEWLDLREEIMLLPEDDGDLIPFMAWVGVKDRFCFDLDGQIVLRLADGQRELVGLTFAQLLRRELDLLKHRLAQLKIPASPRKGKGKQST